MKRALNLLLVLLLVTFVVACARQNNASSQAARPVANITSPAPNSSMLVGQETLITFSAADVKGIARAELLINGQVVMQEVVDPPVNSYAASHRWLPETAGNQVIELRALNVDNVANDLVQVFVTVTEPVVEATATPTPTDTPAPVIFTPTVTPTPSPEVVETPTATPSAALVTALVRLNIRLGPSTDYPVVGILAVNESAPVTGRDQFSQWWQIEFQSANSNRGWVSSSAGLSAATDVEAVPIAEGPLLETVVTATATPTDAPPTPTPDPRPVISAFSATKYIINSGESVELSWDLSNAQAAYLRYDGLEEGVVAPGKKLVAPTKETVYTLVARNSSGEVTAELTITIGTSSTPAPVLRDGKIRIADGQFIDFDQGLVLGVGDPRSDFQWSGSTQKFWPQSGATGALLSRPYGQITLEDCRNTAYDKPIDGVDGSTQVTGCYRTNEGRFGKFLVSEWDLAANLTIEWLTWQ